MDKEKEHKKVKEKVEEEGRKGEKPPLSLKIMREFVVDHCLGPRARGQLAAYSRCKMGRDIEKCL